MFLTADFLPLRFAHSLFALAESAEHSRHHVTSNGWFVHFLSSPVLCAYNMRIDVIRPPYVCRMPLSSRWQKAPSNLALTHPPTYGIQPLVLAFDS